jgi:Rad51
MANGQSIQFSCSKCKTILTEAASPDRPPRISEECPGCGCQLSETLQMQPKKQDASMRHALFQTAYEINACLGLGIREIDSFLALRSGDRLCIVGDYANLLVSRLCVRAFLPVRQGGLGAGSVVFVDAGNSSDIYRCASFARQFGLEIQKVLRGIAVSRAFTIHQLAGLVAHELPKAVRQFNAKLVVVSDLLRMFTEDPQVSRKEARYLINEIMESVHRMGDVLLVMSLHGSSPYDGRILPSFGKRIEANPLGIRLYNGRNSRQVAMPEKELYIAR